MKKLLILVTLVSFWAETSCVKAMPITAEQARRMKRIRRMPTRKVQTQQRVMPTRRPIQKRRIRRRPMPRRITAPAPRRIR